MEKLQNVQHPDAEDYDRYIVEDEEVRGGYRRSARLQESEINQLAKAATAGQGNRKQRRKIAAELKRRMR